MVEAAKAVNEMIKKIQTWGLLPRSKNKKVIGVKQIYKAKANLDSSIYEYIKQDFQLKDLLKVSVGHFKTFASVARHGK